MEAMGNNDDDKQHYIDEFTFRFNHRENEEIFEKLIINTIL